jgi:hypothetical protein
LLYSLIVKARFENNRFRKPKKQPKTSTEHVDWFWLWNSQGSSINIYTSDFVCFLGLQMQYWSSKKLPSLQSVNMWDFLISIYYWKKKAKDPWGISSSNPVPPVPGPNPFLKQQKCLLDTGCTTLPRPACYSSLHCTSPLLEQCIP